MRLTDADALPIRKAYIVDEAGFGATFYVVDLENIDCAPTIDAVPVVRCKDCKYWFRNNGHDKNGCPITDSDIWMDDSGFCSHGERRDDA